MKLVIRDNIMKEDETEDKLELWLKYCCSGDGTVYLMSNRASVHKVCTEFTISSNGLWRRFPTGNLNDNGG